MRMFRVQFILGTGQKRDTVLIRGAPENGSSLECGTEIEVWLTVYGFKGLCDPWSNDLGSGNGLIFDLFQGERIKLSQRVVFGHDDTELFRSKRDRMKVIRVFQNGTGDADLGKTGAYIFCDLRRKGFAELKVHFGMQPYEVIKQKMEQRRRIAGRHGQL